LDGGLLNSFSGLYTTQVGDYSGGQPFADFLLGAQQGITVNSNVQISPDRRNAWQMYFQDDWKIHPKVTLQLGLRYDLNLPSTIANGRAGAWLEGLDHRNGQLIVWPKDAAGPLQKVLGGSPLGFPDRFSNNNWLSKPNWKNLGPRVGVAYRPLNDNRTVIRAGYGIYYDLLVGTMTNNRNFGKPFFTFGSTPPRPVDFEAPPYLLGQFPAVPNNFQAGEPFRSGYVFSPEWPDARVQQWNLTVQRDLGHGFVVDVGYVGNRATQEALGLRINQSFPVGYTFHYNDGKTFTIEDSTPLLQRKQYPGLRTGTAVVPWGHGTYNAAQMTLTKQMSAGIEFRLGYTRSRTYGNVSTDQQPTIQDEWSLNKLNFYEAQDLPNIFFGTFVWELPGRSLKGPAGVLLGGWRAGSIIHVQSGPRVDVLEDSPQFEGAGGSVKPLLVCDRNLPSSQRSVDRWFNTSCFQQPGPNQLGSDAAYYSVRSDALRNIDFSLAKSFKFSDVRRLTFRAEAFNLFNHPTFGAPDTNRGDATFGQVTSAGRARELQMALKFQF
jgi:hypothetical protein